MRDPARRFRDQSVQKGTCLRMREVVAIGSLFFTFLTLVRIATCQPVGPITAVNGSNDAPRLELYIPYGFDYKNFTKFSPQKF